MKIYTKKGDKGTTSLIGGQRVSKSHIRIETYGTIDELNSFLGLLRSKNIDTETNEIILRTQNNLFTIGAYFATDQNSTKLEKYAILDKKEVEYLEETIDFIDKKLDRLTNFIIYGENETSAIAHVCRAVARRVERNIIAVNEELNVDENIIKYINRLSDFLFVLARYCANENKNKNIFWQK